MTWPLEYGGSARSFFERYIVTEELLAAGSPVTAHWIADRQTGPLLLNYGSEAQKNAYLPAICSGECYFSIGMSEPDSGSDLASIRTTATAVDGGWRVNGTKLWTTSAHWNHYMVALVRSSPLDKGNRHAGMSQLIIDLQSEGVEIRPIKTMAGTADFSEVVFTDTFVPCDSLVGDEGNGWTQVTSELAYERSGPERFLSSFRVFVELLRALGEADRLQHQAVGKLAANLITLRRMSLSVAGMLEAGKVPALEAALIKELGNNFEKNLPEMARQLLPEECDRACFDAAYRDSLLLSPTFTLRGGTREILRGVIARGLGLR